MAKTAANKKKVAPVKQKKTGGGTWKPGVSGNPNGRPRKPEIEQLRDAIIKVQTQKKTDLLEHLVSRAFESDAVMIALAKKIVPDLSSVQGDFNVRQKILQVFGMDQLKK